eukprot:161833_1
MTDKPPPRYKHYTPNQNHSILSAKRNQHATNHHNLERNSTSITPTDAIKIIPYSTVTSSNALLAIDNIKIHCITKEIAIIRWKTTVIAATDSSMKSLYAIQLNCFVDDHTNFQVYSDIINLPYDEFNTSNKFSHMIFGLTTKLKYRINLITYEIKNAKRNKLTKFSMKYSNNIKYYNEYIIASYLARVYTKENYNKIDDGIFVFIACMISYVRFETNHPKIRVSSDHLTATWRFNESVQGKKRYATIIFGDYLCARDEQIFEATFRINNDVGQDSMIRFGFVTQEFESRYENDNYDIHQFDYNSVVCFENFYKNDRMRTRSKFKNIRNISQFDGYKLKKNDVIIVQMNMKSLNGNVYFLKNNKRELIFNTRLPYLCGICIAFGSKHNSSSVWVHRTFQICCVDQRWLEHAKSKQ